MRLFLIRHGESVDNVAGLYAGSRDSPLTAHGVLQTRRLGDHLASRSGNLGPIRRVFSSDLQRAANTAQAIADAHARLDTATTNTDEADTAVAGKLAVVQVPDLRERDFRSTEGTNFGQRVTHTDAETHEEMRVRSQRFVDDHLLPAFEDCGSHADSGGSIVVVAHGLILNSLLRVLLSRFGSTERSEQSAGWSNTGYLEAVVKIVRGIQQKDASSSDATKPSPEKDQRVSSKAVSGVKMTVMATNVTTHLQGLKKTRGGIGSAQFDKKQRTMESFFGPPAKKPKING